MNTLPVWQLAVGLSLISAIGGALLVPRAIALSRTEERLHAVVTAAGRHAINRPETPAPAWIRMLSGIGAAVLKSGLLSQAAIDDLRQTMAATGNRTGLALGLFVGTKLCLLVGLPLLAWFAIQVAGLQINPFMTIAAAGMAGLMLPDLLVRRRRRRYLKQVDLGLPAALDLLIICAEAGLALEAGLERVADDSREANAATANELRITANEMKILGDRRDALTNMGKRTGLETMTRLGSVLAQSLKYGTPLTQALRVLAAEMRQITLNRFEARAAKIPVLLTVPMVLFILPCMFVVIGGPAVVRVMLVWHSN